MAKGFYQTPTTPRLYVSYPAWQYANGGLTNVYSMERYGYAGNYGSAGALPYADHYRNYPYSIYNIFDGVMDGRYYYEN